MTQYAWKNEVPVAVRFRKLTMLSVTEHASKHLFWLPEENRPPPKTHEAKQRESGGH